MHKKIIVYYRAPLLLDVPLGLLDIPPELPVLLVESLGLPGMLLLGELVPEVPDVPSPEEVLLGLSKAENSEASSWPSLLTSAALKLLLTSGEFFISSRLIFPSWFASKF